MEYSGILLVVVEPAVRDILAAILTAGGENVEPVQDVAAARDAMAAGNPDLIVADAHLVDEIRTAAGSIPILALGDEQAPRADAMLATPLRGWVLTEAVRGLLGVDRMAGASVQQAVKLAALLGAEAAAAMIGRYLDGLADGIAQIEAGGDARAIGHRLGGMGGMLGFDVLGTAWLSLENHGIVAWPLVRELTREAIERHRETR